MGRLRTLALTGLATAATAALGAAATTPEADWYDDLDLPAWQPPPIAFPLVWTPLYADLAVSSGLAMARLSEQGRHDEARTLRQALGANLVLNAGWSVLFWRSRRPWLSTAWCATLAASSADLSRRVGRADRRLGTALSPYAAWCGFATVLNGEIARRNA